MTEKSLSIKKLPKSRVRFELELNDSALSKYEQKALEKLALKTNLSGFRPGKIPADILKEHYGAEYIRAYIIDTAFPDIYADVVKKENLEVVSQPEVKEISSNPVLLEVTVEVFPEVKIGDYKKISVPKKEVKISENEVQEVLKNLQQRNARYTIKSGKAKNGDRVEIHFSGEFEKGVKDDRLSSKHHPLILGSKSFIPGFEEELTGLEKGEKKTFEITFPKEYHHSDFQGKKATFEVEVVEVEEVVLPELDEKFVKDISGKEQTLDEFKKDVEEQLKQKMTKDIDAQRENELLDKIFQLTDVELPESLINEEIHFMMEDLKKRLSEQKMDFDHYLQHLKKTEEDLRKGFEKEAQKRVTLRLAIQEIIKQEHIEISDEEMKEKIEGLKNLFPKKEHYRFDKEYTKGKPLYEKLEREMKVYKMIDTLLHPV